MNELDTVYDVLRGYLPRPKRHQVWRKWKPVLERYPLSTRTPFLNIVSFVNEIARENEFDYLQKMKFRSDLLRSLVKKNSYGDKNILPMNLNLKQRVLKAQYKYSGITKFENATIAVDEKSNLILATKRRMVTGTPVRIRVPKGKGDENSMLRISGDVAHIDSSRSSSHFKYVIRVRNTDHALAA